MCYLPTYSGLSEKWKRKLLWFVMVAEHLRSNSFGGLGEMQGTRPNPMHTSKEPLPLDRAELCLYGLCSDGCSAGPEQAHGGQGECGVRWLQREGGLLQEVPEHQRGRERALQEGQRGVLRDGAQGEEPRSYCVALLDCGWWKPDCVALSGWVWKLDCVALSSWKRRMWSEPDCVALSAWRDRGALRQDPEWIEEVEREIEKWGTGTELNEDPVDTLHADSSAEDERDWRAGGYRGSSSAMVGEGCYRSAACEKRVLGQQPEEEQQQIGEKEMPLEHDREEKTSTSVDVCGYGESCEVHGPASVHGENCRDDTGSNQSSCSSSTSKWQVAGEEQC